MLALAETVFVIKHSLRYSNIMSFPEPSSLVVVLIPVIYFIHFEIEYIFFSVS